MEGRYNRTDLFLPVKALSRHYYHLNFSLQLWTTARGLEDLLQTDTILISAALPPVEFSGDVLDINVSMRIWTFWSKLDTGYLIYRCPFVCGLPSAKEEQPAWHSAPPPQQSTQEKHQSYLPYPPTKSAISRLFVTCHSMENGLGCK